MTKSNRPSPSLHDFVADFTLSVLLFVIGLQLTHHKKKRQSRPAGRRAASSQSRTCAQKAPCVPHLLHERAQMTSRILS